MPLRTRTLSRLRDQLGLDQASLARPARSLLERA